MRIYEETQEFYITTESNMFTQTTFMYNGATVTR